MADLHSLLNSVKFEEQVTVTSNTSKYLHKSDGAERKVEFTLSFNNSFVQKLGKACEKYSLSHVTVLNSQIPFIEVLERARVETRLRSLVYEVSAKLRGESRGGRQRYIYLSKKRSIAIFEGELLNVREQVSALADQKRSISRINNDIDSLEKILS